MFTDRCVQSIPLEYTSEHMLGANSDHGIQKRGANREVYEFMTSFLIEKWGKGWNRKLEG